MRRSHYAIPKMDCPAEETLVRMKLRDVPSARQLAFDLAERSLIVVHDGSADAITRALDELALGSRLVRTGAVSGAEVPARDAEHEAGQRKLLWTVFGINLGFFVLELGAGLAARSMGLVADSLDMLADAFVYGLALVAVGGSLARKTAVARASGYLQLALAVAGFLEVVRRAVGAEAMPDVATMIVVSLLALVGNGLCLMLLQRSRSREVHLRATMIFTSNDVVVNLGVIVAGLLVLWLDSGLPDLVVGAIVFVVVSRGAFRILRIAASGGGPRSAPVQR